MIWLTALIHLKLNISFPKKPWKHIISEKITNKKVPTSILFSVALRNRQSHITYVNAKEQWTRSMVFKASRSRATFTHILSFFAPPLLPSPSYLLRICGAVDAEGLFIPWYVRTYVSLIEEKRSVWLVGFTCVRMPAPARAKACCLTGKINNKRKPTEPNVEYMPGR